MRRATATGLFAAAPVVGAEAAGEGAAVEEGEAVGAEEAPHTAP